MFLPCSITFGACPYHGLILSFYCLYAAGLAFDFYDVVTVLHFIAGGGVVLT